jgi:acyl carrier protein
MDTLTRLTRILRDTLMLTDRAERFDPEMRLLGALPSFDSMAVVSVLTAIEGEFGITVEDDELSADVFETMGSLQHFVESKLAE